MNIIGTIQLIRDVEQFQRGSLKRSIVIKTDDKYPQILEVEFWNDKADLLNMLRQNEKVSIDVNLNGRLWESKDGKQVVFMSLTGYRIDQQQPSQPLPRDPINLNRKQMGNIESNFLEDAINDMCPDDDDSPF